MEKMQHFIGSAAPALALVALELVREGVAVIHGTSDNGLLPLVHTLWHPILVRCAHATDAPEVILAALQLIRVMVGKTGDFLLGKFSELWPIVSKHLVQLARANGIFATHTNFEFLPAFKMQLAMLDCVTELVHAEAVHGRSQLPLQEIARTCGMYLQSTQVDPLQQAARRLFTAIIDDDADAIWLQLMRWSHTPLPPPPTPNCKPLAIQFDPSTAHSFNARLLLGVLHQRDVQRMKK